MTKVVNLLKEYEDLFPRRFLEMKEIVGSLGEMNFQLNLDANMVKKRPH
jgi:hypothetical protein